MVNENYWGPMAQRQMPRRTNRYRKNIRTSRTPYLDPLTLRPMNPRMRSPTFNNFLGIGPAPKSLCKRPVFRDPLLIGQGPVHSKYKSRGKSKGPQMIDWGLSVRAPSRTLKVNNVPINPLRITSPQEKKMGYRQARRPFDLAPFGDYDSDGLANYRDCRPLDPTRHGILEAIGGAISGAFGGEKGSIKKGWKEGMAKPNIVQRYREERRQKAERTSMQAPVRRSSGGGGASNGRLERARKWAEGTAAQIAGKSKSAEDMTAMAEVRKMERKELRQSKRDAEEEAFKQKVLKFGTEDKTTEEGNIFHTGLYSAKKGEKPKRAEGKEALTAAGILSAVEIEEGAYQKPESSELDSIKRETLRQRYEEPRLVTEEKIGRGGKPYLVQVEKPAALDPTYDRQLVLGVEPQYKMKEKIVEIKDPKTGEVSNVIVNKKVKVGEKTVYLPGRVKIKPYDVVEKKAVLSPYEVMKMTLAQTGVEDVTPAEAGYGGKISKEKLAQMRAETRRTGVQHVSGMQALKLAMQRTPQPGEEDLGTLSFMGDRASTAHALGEAGVPMATSEGAVLTVGPTDEAGRKLPLVAIRKGGKVVGYMYGRGGPQVRIKDRQDKLSEIERRGLIPGGIQVIRDVRSEIGPFSGEYSKRAPAIKGSSKTAQFGRWTQGRAQDVSEDMDYIQKAIEERKLQKAYVSAMSNLEESVPGLSSLVSSKPLVVGYDEKGEPIIKRDWTGKPQRSVLERFSRASALTKSEIRHGERPSKKMERRIPIMTRMGKAAFPVLERRQFYLSQGGAGSRPSVTTRTIKTKSGLRAGIRHGTGRPRGRPSGTTYHFYPDGSPMGIQEWKKYKTHMKREAKLRAQGLLPPEEGQMQYQMQAQMRPRRLPVPQEFRAQIPTQQIPLEVQQNLPPEVLQQLAEAYPQQTEYMTQPVPSEYLPEQQGPRPEAFARPSQSFEGRDVSTYPREAYEAEHQTFSADGGPQPRQRPVRDVFKGSGGKPYPAVEPRPLYGGRFAPMREETDYFTGRPIIKDNKNVIKERWI